VTRVLKKNTQCCIQVNSWLCSRYLAALRRGRSFYTARGDYVNAGLSAAACIPFAGWTSTGGKLANKAYTVYQGVDKATGAVKYLGITSR